MINLRNCQNSLKPQAAKFNVQFTKLYAHVEQRFGELSAKLEKTRVELKADINQIRDLVDEDLKRRETDEQERIVMNHQLDRQDDWIGRASKQVGISYER